MQNHRADMWFEGPRIQTRSFWISASNPGMVDTSEHFCPLFYFCFHLYFFLLITLNLFSAEQEAECSTLWVLTELSSHFLRTVSFLLWLLLFFNFYWSQFRKIIMIKISDTLVLDWRGLLGKILYKKSRVNIWRLGFPFL